MLSELALQLASFSPSVGWVIDRSGETEEVIGTVWLAADGLVATCAYIYMPYAEIIEALIVRFPLSNHVFSVSSAKFHPGFDQWAAKRLLSQADFYPPPLLTSLENNLVFLELSDVVTPLSAATSAKIEQALSSKERGEFAGRVSNIELAGIMQSLLSNRQTGTLVVSDSHKRTFARLFCENGQIKYVRFKDSYNEQAMYRLVSTPFKGYFFFQFEEKPQWCDFPPMERATNPVMIEAYMRLDAQATLQANISGPDMLVTKNRDDLDLSKFDESEHEDLPYVWERIQAGTTIGRLMLGCSLDAYIVLHSLELLLHAGMVSVTEAAGVRERFRANNPWMQGLETKNLVPLLTTTDVVLNEDDEIFCLSIDTHSLLPTIESGAILESRRPGDEYHHFISIHVPPEAVGAPIFKNGIVVGMHCGQIARDNQASKQAPMSDYMLKMDSIESLIAELTGKRRSSKSPKTLVERELPGALESVEEQSVTLTDLQKMAESRSMRAVGSSDKNATVKNDGTNSSAGKVSAIQGNPLGALVNTFSNVFQPFSKQEESSNEWFNVEFIRAKYGSIKWQKTNLSTQFVAGDVLRLEVRLEKNMHFYAAYQRAGGRGVHLLNPDQGETDNLEKTGTVIELPRKNNSDKSSSGRTTSSKNALVGLTLSGTPETPDSVLFISCSKPLEQMHDQVVRTEMFHKALALLVAEKNLVPHAIPLNDLLPSPFTSDGAIESAESAQSDNTKVVIAKLQISCRSNR
jgi:hypothetical protein